MARFDIISASDGTVTRYSGSPTYTGTYMKPGMLEFREISSPVPIPWEVGDYVVYSRTGLTYKLYSTPQLKRRAGTYLYGGAFVYQNVQFYDASKELEICPFRDLVTGDNRIHFTTQPSISTFEDVSGIAARIQACLDDMYPNEWNVRVATVSMGAAQDLVDLMDEARDFTVSGVSLLGALEKVYEVWPEVGWVFEMVSGTKTITIGGAGLVTPDTYSYGKGNGLLSVTRTVANADSIANRIYAYGSSRNMLPKWYNNQTIKDAASVDIQHLMIPVEDWGTTTVNGTELPDAAKAYVQSNDSIALIGLRPKTVYFDGSGDMPEIYPTLENVTIGEIRAKKGEAYGDTSYIPSSAWADSDRADTIYSVPTTFDDGLSGDESGKNTLYNGYGEASETGTTTVSAGSTRYTMSVITEAFTFTESEAGVMDVSINVSLDGTLGLTGIKSARAQAYFRKGHPANAAIISQEHELDASTTQEDVYDLSSFTLYGRKKTIEAATYYLVVDIEVDCESSSSDLTLSYDADAAVSVSLAYHRSETFSIVLRQIGFDIDAQSALGDGKVISMRSGSCAGRSFTIKSVQYNETADTWTLDVIRSQDDSLSQWFPNSSYPVAAGDEFVLLDIAMPQLYVWIAEERLKTAAEELLADISVERYQYTPDIDAKFMIESGRVITPGQYMTIYDYEVVNNEEGDSGERYFLTSNGVYFMTSGSQNVIIGENPTSVTILVDTVSITDNEEPIPTYKVTLRERKRLTLTESSSVTESASNPVTSLTSASSSSSSSSSSDSYFTLDDSGNVTLKSAYSNLWVPGWLAAGGVQDGESGGSSTLSGLTDVLLTDLTDGQVLVWDASSNKWINGSVSGVVTVDDELSSTSTNPVQNAVIYAALSDKQDTLVSGTTIKTINGVSILGSGDITISGGGSGSTIVVTPSLTEGTQIASISVDGTATDLYAPSGTVTSVTLRSGTGISVSSSGTAITTSGTRTINISSAYQTYITRGNTAYGWGDHSEAGYLTSSSVTNNAATLTAATTVTLATIGETAITAVVPDFALSSELDALESRVTLLEHMWVDDGNGNVTLNSSYYSNAWVPGWLAAGGIGSGSGSGGSVVSVTQVLTTGTQIATITVDGSSTALYAPTASGVTSITLTSGTGVTVSNSGTAITSTGTRTISISSAYQTYISNGNTAYGWGNHANAGYVTIADAQTITGVKTFTGSETIFTGDLTLSSTSVIDLGPLRLEYDSTNNAWHITSNDGSTVNLYADGWISAGGIQS